MSLTCELSGEPLASTSDEVVATPSGHVCLKRLLLAKLSENGGMDPFEPIRERPLSEDQLIGLVNVNNGSQNKIPPPRSSETSIPNLLQTIQTEYDALVLELFDTRKALEETRKELSQALYQNDAAVRVVARLSMERDAARHELERWNASVVNVGNDAVTATTTTTTEAMEVTTTATPTGDEPPKTKRRRVDNTSSSSLPLKNDLPQEDLNAMVTTWQQLQPQRKPSLSAAKAAAPTPDDLANFTEVDKKSWHKSTCRSVTCMAASSTTDSNLVATAGKDKQLIVYHTIEKVVKHTIHLGSVATCVDIHGSLVVAGDEKGKLQVFSVEDGTSIGTWNTEGGASIVDVRIHPTTKHLCVATSNGRLVVCCILEADGEGGSGERVQTVAQFYEGDGETNNGVQYSCGALHPDGLLYAAGTTKGQVHMWDFKNKVLASTLQEGDADDAVVAVAFSNNGYHLATAHDESAAVRFWDLRKQKTMAVMNLGKELLESVTSLTYDPSGQYVAFGGKGGVKITTVKKWETTASLESNVVSGLVWNDPSIVGTCSNKQRAVYFHGLLKSSS